VVLAGDPATEEFRAMAAVLHEKLGPRRVLLRVDGGADQQWLAMHRSFLAAIPAGEGAAAYLCENATCQPPVRDAGALRALLA
jgi:uncharacterized protein YyaL (SSP411 family)